MNMPETKIRNRENRLRGQAARRGYNLKKCRTRSLEHPDYGTYCLVDDRNCLILGDRNTGYGVSLEEIEEYLKD